MIRILLVVSIIVLSQGCSSTRVIRRGEAFELEKPATLVTAEQESRVTQARVEGDSLVVGRSGAEWRVPLDEVRMITRKNRGRGAAIGAVAGVVVGAVLGYAAGSSDPSGPLESRGEGAGITGAFGLLLGWIPGGIIGTKETYRFEEGAAAEAVRTPAERLARRLDRLERTAALATRRKALVNGSTKRSQEAN